MMIKKINVLCLSISLMASASCLAMSTQEIDDNQSLITKDFIERQVTQNMSIGRAIKSITSHYPQHVESIVGNALDLYPDQYREIIHAAISSQPALTEDVVRISMEKGVSDCLDIVKVAINAEPGYVDFVVNAAANSEPTELGEIVRVAVVTQPDSAGTIVQSVGKQHPSRLKEIVRSALKAVPVAAEYVVDSLLAIFPGQAESVVSTAVKQSMHQSGQVEKIIESGKTSGLSDEELTKYAILGGATTEQVAAILNEEQ